MYRNLIDLAGFIVNVDGVDCSICPFSARNHCGACKPWQDRKNSTGPILWTVWYQPSSRLKRVVVTSLKLSISLAILGYLFHCAAGTDQFSVLTTSETHWSWIGLAVLLCLVAHVISFLRWRVMVLALGLPFSVVDALRIGFIGSFFNLFAFGVVGGDTLRSFYVARQVPQRIPEAVASVIADRLIGMLTMFTFASIAFLALDFESLADQVSVERWQAFRFTCWVILTMTGGGYLGLVVVWQSPRLARVRWFARLGQIPWLGALVRRFANVIAIYRGRPGALLAGFAMSALVNISFVACIYAVAVAIQRGGPSFANFWLIAPISMVANAAPLPGGLGGMELALDFLYRLFAVGLSEPRGVVIAFAYRFVLLVVSALGAVAWLMSRKSIHAVEAQLGVRASTGGQ